MNEARFNPVEQQEKQEYGRNVAIKIKFIRHGDRDKEGHLSDFGREDARSRATEFKSSADDFDAVKAIGSSKSPGSEVVVKDDIVNMGRALETAHIYAEELDAEQKFVSRINDLLNFESIKTPTPYDHLGIYNSNLPDDFDDLSADEKAKAGDLAQTKTIEHMFSLEGPEVEKFKKETAGAFAYLLEHYTGLSKKLKEGSNVLMIAGSHSPNLEMLLQQVLIHEDEDGQEQVGFDNPELIGGAIQTADSYDVDIVLDESGELQDLIVSFDEEHRPQGNMRLDMDKIKELASFYKELHKGK